jgi:small nuclear ribonucleoprotein (snRNP)-like protein
MLLLAHFAPSRSDTLSQGFDEFMNLVLDDAEEVWLPRAATEKRAATELTRKPLGAFLQAIWTAVPISRMGTGRILLKGETIVSITAA